MPGSTSIGDMDDGSLLLATKALQHHPAIYSLLPSLTANIAKSDIDSTIAL